MALNPMAAKAVSNAVAQREKLPWYAKAVVPDPMNPGIAVGSAPVIQPTKDVGLRLASQVGPGVRSAGREFMQLLRYLRKQSGPLSLKPSTEFTYGAYSTLPWGKLHSIEINPNMPNALTPKEVIGHETGHWITDYLPNEIRNVFDRLLENVSRSKVGNKYLETFKKNNPQLMDREAIINELPWLAHEQGFKDEIGPELIKKLIDLRRITRGATKAWLRQGGD